MAVIFQLLDVKQALIEYRVKTGKTVEEELSSPLSAWTGRAPRALRAQSLVVGSAAAVTYLPRSLRAFTACKAALASVDRGQKVGVRGQREGTSCLNSIIANHFLKFLEVPFFSANG